MLLTKENLYIFCPINSFSILPSKKMSKIILPEFLPHVEEAVNAMEVQTENVCGCDVFRSYGLDTPYTPGTLEQQFFSFSPSLKFAKLTVKPALIQYT